MERSSSVFDRAPYIFALPGSFDGYPFGTHVAFSALRQPRLQALAMNFACPTLCIRYRDFA